MTRLPQYFTPEVDAYHVSFQNQRAGSRIYGMLSVPTKPGKYPAMLGGALDPRVKAIGVVHPAMSDQFGYFQDHTGGWPHIFHDTTNMRACRKRRRHCATTTTSSFATCNTVTAPKQMMLFPETGHFLVRPQREALDAFLLKALGVAP